MIIQILLLLLLAWPAAAQYPPLPPVFQSGNVTPGHITGWCANGVVCDTGVVTSQITTVNGPCVNITTFGARADSFTDNSPALVNALAALGSQGGCIEIPAGNGQYLFAANVTYTIPAGASYGLDIHGDSMDSSVLYWPGGGGLTINQNNTNIVYSTQSVRVHDLSITTGSVGVGNGLVINESGVHTGSFAPINAIERVAFRSNDHYVGLNYWNNAIVISNGVSNTNVVGVIIEGPPIPAGTGISAFGTPTNIGVVLNVIGCTVNQMQFGFNYGSNFQGVSLVSDNLTGNINGVYTAPATTGAAQLSIVNSQFGVSSSVGFGILLNTAVDGLLMTNNLFVLQGTSGSSAAIDLISAGVFNMHGNQILNIGTQPTTTGLAVTANPTSRGGAVTGNTFYNLTNGIALQAGTNNINAGYGNTFLGNTTPVANSGTNNIVSGGNLIH